MPAPVALPPSAATQIAGQVLAIDDDVSGRTQIHAGVPAPPLAHGTATATSHGMPALRPPAQPLLGDIEIAEPTDISLPPEPPGALLADTIDQAMADPEPADPDHHAGSTAPMRSDPFARLVGHPSDHPPDGDGSQRPRHTVIGMAITPTGAPVLPARPAPAQPGTSPAQARDTTGLDGRTRGDGPVDPVGPTLPPDGRHAAAAVDEPTPIVGWAMDGAGPPEDPPPPLASHPGAAHGLPNGDWTIALDPAAPDGWTAPKPPPPPVVGTGRASGSHGALAPSEDAAEPSPRPPPPSSALPAEPKVQIDPTLIEPLQGAPAENPAPPPPGFAMPVAPALPMYSAPLAPGGSSPPPFPMLTMPSPGVLPPAHGAPATPGQGGYPLDPGYLAMPAIQQVDLRIPHGGLGDPRYAASATHAAQRRRRLIIVLASALIAVLLGIAALLVMRARPGATRLAPHATTDGHTIAANDPPARAKPAPVGDPASPATAPSAAPAPTPATTAAGSAALTSGAPPGAATDTSPPATGTGSATAAAPPAEPSADPASTPAPARSCFADVRSQPSGADIFIAKSRVLGTTPRRVALPCGAPVDLVIRKARLAPVTRTITPTPDAPSLVEVSLTRQTFLVKVSSTPSGATITLGGKQLGVTPTIVRVPAFEASILSISKDGYDLETERVAPRSNGLVVHSVLKRADRKRAR